MMVSTRGRYAIRVMIDLAENAGKGYIPMWDIAKRQDISPNYLARILPVLAKNGLIDGVHGKGGGYKLMRPAKDCMVGEILRLTEESLAPVACLECSAEPCKRAAECKTLPMWKKVNCMLDDYFDRISIQDIIDGNI